MQINVSRETFEINNKNEKTVISENRKVKQKIKQKKIK